MKSMSVVGLAIVLFVTIGMGIVQGRLTNRWGVQPDAEQAANQLKQKLPEMVGNWRMRTEGELDETVQKMLQCPAYIARVYEHQQTGDVVNMALILGPPGPISVHTPEVCYSSREYTPDGVRQQVTLKDQANRQHVIWCLGLKPNNLESSALRVFYGWSTGTRFAAPELPRFSFGGLPHLYKLQVAVTEHPSSKAIDFDAGKDFLECFLPQLAPQMVEASRKTNSGE